MTHSRVAASFQTHGFLAPESTFSPGSLSIPLRIYNRCGRCSEIPWHLLPTTPNLCSSTALTRFQASTLKIVVGSQLFVTLWNLKWMPEKQTSTSPLRSPSSCSMDSPSPNDLPWVLREVGGGGGGAKAKRSLVTTQTRDVPRITFHRCMAIVSSDCPHLQRKVHSITYSREINRSPYTRLPV